MKTVEISDIDKMLLKLPKSRIQEVRDFVGYLIEKEKKHRAFVKRVLKAEKEPDVVECKTPEEFIQAILDAPDDDDEGQS